MDLAKVAAALSDPVRISMLELIAGLPGQSSSACADPSVGNLEATGVCVCEFAQHLKISQPRASYHLKILREAGLVSEEPRGKWTYYGLEPERVKEFCRRLQRATALEKPRGGAEDVSRRPKGQRVGSRLLRHAGVLQRRGRGRR